jgi:hypothetical protein
MKNDVCEVDTRKDVKTWHPAKKNPCLDEKLRGKEFKL